MNKDTEQTSATETSADQQDGGWDMDSASLERGPTPNDTTTAEGRQYAGLSAQEGQSEDGESADDGEVETASADDSSGIDSQSRATAEEKPRKGRKSSTDRQREIQAAIDAATARRHQAERELAETLERLERARVAHERPPSAAALPPAASAGTQRPGSGLPPKPRLADFDSEDEYHAAVDTWIEQRETLSRDSIKRELIETVEARLQREAGERSRQQAETALATRLAAARAQYEDWDEHIGNLDGIQSPWATRPEFGPTPFLSDLIQNSPHGGHILHFVASDRERAQALANLVPIAPIRDAIVMSSSPLLLLDHFATPEGAAEFEQIKAMPHPVMQLQAVGALTARLAAAVSSNGGPARGVHPITQAAPPAKPPVGTPRARGQATGSPRSFDDWMDEENRKELADKLKSLGIPAA